jgi:hypothetical protein
VRPVIGYLIVDTRERLRAQEQGSKLTLSVSSATHKSILAATHRTTSGCEHRGSEAAGRLAELPEALCPETAFDPYGPHVSDHEAIRSILLRSLRGSLRPAGRW